MPVKEYIARLSSQRSETQIPDLKPAYSEAQAVTEAQRCIYCHDAPCITACPTGIDIPEFIRKIATGNYKGSARTILEANILGMSCARVCPVEVLCVGSCVYHHKGEKPIEIGKLQRFATDWAYARNIQYFTKGPATGRQVALIGGGPASLACAAELAILGHHPVLFDKHAYPGGLNTDGVAPYKMQADASLREAAYIQDIGVEMRLGVEIGQDKTFAELEAEFDAIFIGVGIGPDSWMRIEGENLANCLGALEMIAQIKLGRFDISPYRRAVVIGGGNTALDAVRELKKLGVPEVTLVYRRTEAEMSGYRHEMDWARKEGVHFCFLTQPVAVIGNGKVEALHCVQMQLSAPDESGRRAPVPVGNSEFEIPADLVVEAIGQAKLDSFLQTVPEIKVERGRVVVDAEGRTSHARYFAGGDCANGGKEVVNAAAEGKRAARAIDGYLKQLPSGTTAD